MNRRACAVVAATLGLALGPAIASAQDAPRQIAESTGAGQVGPTEADPAVAADAPVTVNAPVTVLSPDSGGDASGGGGGGASAGGGGGPARGGQDTTGSSGTAQIGSVAVTPTAGADAPVTPERPRDDPVVEQRQGGVGASGRRPEPG